MLSKSYKSSGGLAEDICLGAVSSDDPVSRCSGVCFFFAGAGVNQYVPRSVSTICLGVTRSRALHLEEYDIA